MEEQLNALRSFMQKIETGPKQMKMEIKAGKTYEVRNESWSNEDGYDQRTVEGGRTTEDEVKTDKKSEG